MFAYLFLLLFLLQLSLFLLSELGLLLLFPLTFVFTSFITHIHFSVVESKVCKIGPMFSALGPLDARPSVYDDRCPVWSSS